MILLAGLLLVVGCSDVMGPKTSTLTVSLQNELGEDIEGTVKVDGNEKTGSSVQFELLKAGDYTVNANAITYKEKSKQVTMDGEDTTVYITLEAAPIEDPSEPAQEPTDLSGATVVYSDATGGTAANVGTMNQFWYGSINYSEIDVSENNVAKYQYSGTAGECVGITFDPIDASSEEVIKLDVYVTDKMKKIAFKPVDSSDNGKEYSYTVGTDISANEWNTVTIDLSSSDLNTSSIAQLGVIIKKGGLAGQAMYLDNIYLK